MSNPPNMAMENNWNEDLYDCCKDCTICCYGYCCTPCLFGSNAKKIDNKNFFVWCCIYILTAYCYLCWIPHMMMRKKMRTKYHLKEQPCGDCPTTLCCSPCALCQEAREMKVRGKQPNVAYNVNTGGPVVTEPGAYVIHKQPGGPGYNPQQGGYGYNPQQSGYGYNHQQSGYGYNPQPGGQTYNHQQSGYGYNPQQGGYEYNPQPTGQGYNHQQSGYGYNPQQVGYEYNHQQSGYGYNPQQGGYGYGYSPQQSLQYGNNQQYPMGI